MRPIRILFFAFTLTVCSAFFQELYAQKSETKPVFVIVHGTWGGGWAFKEVDSLMTSKKATVYRPTLTGQGERVHLASNTVGLDTHIMDIVNTILFEDLHNIILVGHSYGGMVVTGVADKIPERISQLVYLDAAVPENGENGLSIFTSGSLEGLKVDEGFLIPQWVGEDANPPMDVPHSLKTWTDKIVLKNPDRLKLSTTFILTVEKDKDPKKDGFASQAKRAKDKNWPVLLLTADHNAQWSAPKELSEMLLGFAQK
ncbi:alpha/beta fold hydrolase [uncultured Algibacter sp.]|uniref:alpha/beta fold hydrolase n=1 Tax=uncultured Algibacter sp. TaxID=298659 RepID=UPI00261F3752|nr:alpha/beta fold hydrolase [uncultured Algibacter sp.]